MQPVFSRRDSSVAAGQYIELARHAPVAEASSNRRRFAMSDPHRSLGRDVARRPVEFAYLFAGCSTIAKISRRRRFKTLAAAPGDVQTRARARGPSVASSGAAARIVRAAPNHVRRSRRPRHARRRGRGSPRPRARGRRPARRLSPLFRRPRTPPRATPRAGRPARAAPSPRRAPAPSIAPSPRRSPRSSAPPPAAARARGARPGTRHEPPRPADARNPVRDLGADLLPRPRTLGASEKSKRPGGRLGASPPAIRTIAGTDARCQREGRREKNKNALAASCNFPAAAVPPRAVSARGAPLSRRGVGEVVEASQSSDGASSSSPRASKQRRATPSPRAGGGARKKRASPLPAGRARARRRGHRLAVRAAKFLLRAILAILAILAPPALDFASLLDILEGTTGDAMDATDSAATNPLGVRDDEYSEGSFLLSRARGGAAKKPRGDDARAISDDVDLGSPAWSDATPGRRHLRRRPRRLLRAAGVFRKRRRRTRPPAVFRTTRRRRGEEASRAPPLLERSASQVSERGAFDLSAFENGCAHASAATTLAR